MVEAQRFENRPHLADGMGVSVNFLHRSED